MTLFSCWKETISRNKDQRTKLGLTLFDGHSDSNAEVLDEVCDHIVELLAGLLAESGAVGVDVAALLRCFNNHRI